MCDLQTEKAKRILREQLDAIDVELARLEPAQHKHMWPRLGQGCHCGAKQCLAMVQPEAKEPTAGTDGRTPRSGYKFAKTAPRLAPAKRCTNAAIAAHEYCEEHAMGGANCAE